MPGKIAARRISQDLHAALVDHRHETAKPLRVDRGQLVAAEQSIAIVPFVHHVNQLDAVALQPIQFLFVVFAGLPRRAAGILAQVVDALRGEVVGDQVLAQALANPLRADADVGESPPVVVRRVADENRRRLGCAGGRFCRGASAAWLVLTGRETAAPAAAAVAPVLRNCRLSMIDSWWFAWMGMVAVVKSRSPYANCSRFS